MILTITLIVIFIFFFPGGKNDYKLKTYEINQPVATMELPKDFNEISGITIDKEDFIYSHDDESAILYKINSVTGKIEKKFEIGNPVLKEDFEDIAIVGDTIWMVTGNGQLFSFPKSDANIDSEYTIYKTGLTNKNDVEGLCYDEKNNRLLLACKGSAGKDFDGKKGVFAFNLGTKELSKEPVIQILLAELRDKYNINDFSPSGIAYNFYSGNYFIISANVSAIIEISPDGVIVDASKLPKRHQQPEGISFLSDGKMFISDEAAGKTPKITIYRRLKK